MTGGRAILGLTAVAAATAALAVGSSPAATVSIGPYPGLGGCPVFPDPPASIPPTAASLAHEDAWNQDISRAPVARNSAAIIRYINSHGADELHPDFGSPRPYGIPYVVVGAGQRDVPINYTAFGDESDKGPFPIPGDAPVEGGSRSDGDRHVLAVDTSDCMLYELYRGFFIGRGGGHWNADSGAKWDLRSADRRPDGLTSADAAGLPIFAGLVRVDEVQRGHVDHAIRVTFDSTRDAWVHPGSHCAGDTSNPSAPPMGLRLRLKPSFGLGRFSGPAKVIARAMKQYGFITADNGSNWYFGGTPDKRWNDENLNQLKTIPGSAFQVVKSAAKVHLC
jgi:hypothetical protein